MLILLIGVLVLSFWSLCRLHFGFAPMWVYFDPPASANEVEDPLLRQLARLWGCCIRPFDRVAGEFSKPEMETKEPKRTHRLLRRPFSAILSETGSDLLDALTLAWLPRAKGQYFIHLLVTYTSSSLCEC